MKTITIALGTVLALGLASIGMTSTLANTQNQTVNFPVNLNTATDTEILAIPNTGPRMLREFKEYRPYVNIDQFKRELGKYVGEDVIAKWLEYVFVPTSPNTATLGQLTALKGVDKTVADHIVANRPYKDWKALETSLEKKFEAKLVSSLERYWVFK